MKNGTQYQVKVMVIGARQVGKSALTVRYLTRRYIGEYKSHTDLSYRQVFCLDGSSIEVEIVDVSNQPEDTSVIPTSRGNKSSDACVVVYSIDDRESFRIAQEALHSLTHPKAPPNPKDRNPPEIHPSSDEPVIPISSSRIPVVLLGNKRDLGHLRQVETSEGKELAKRYGCTCFCEVSAAEMDCTEDHHEENVHHHSRRSSSSNELGLNGIFTQLIREARLHKIRLQDSNNNPDNNHQPSSQQNNNNNNNRQRKRSVFTINRMFGSLMGRNSSMPPELPSARGGKAGSQLGSSMPNVAGSFRSVFKKRSV